MKALDGSVAVSAAAAVAALVADDYIFDSVPQVP
jgi:hypothetical protein